MPIFFQALFKVIDMSLSTSATSKLWFFASSMAAIISEPGSTPWSLPSFLWTDDKNVCASIRYELFDFKREVMGVFSHLSFFVMDSYRLLQSSTATTSGLYRSIVSLTSSTLSCEICAVPTSIILSLTLICNVSPFNLVILCSYPQKTI